MVFSSLENFFIMMFSLAQEGTMLHSVLLKSYLYIVCDYVTEFALFCPKLFKQQICLNLQTQGHGNPILQGWQESIFGLVEYYKNIVLFFFSSQYICNNMKSTEINSSQSISDEEVP